MSVFNFIIDLSGISAALLTWRLTIWNNTSTRFCEIYITDFRYRGPAGGRWCRIMIWRICRHGYMFIHLYIASLTCPSFWWCFHDDVIEWRQLPRYWLVVRGVHRSAVNSPHTGQWRGAFMFSFIRAWIIGWVNNSEAGDLRRHRAHYDVTVMTEQTELHKMAAMILHLLAERPRL